MQIPGLRTDVDAASVPWRGTRHPGIHWLPLHAAREPLSLAEGPESADATVLIRMDPGCGYPAHEHVGIEEVLVLAGGYRDEVGIHRAGSYVRYPSGSRHAPVATGDRLQPIGVDNPACILFAVARGGVVQVNHGQATHADELRAQHGH